MSDRVVKELIYLWVVVILAMLVAGVGLYRDNQSAEAREESVCVALGASAAIIRGLLALPGASAPENAPHVRAYRAQLEDIRGAADRLTGGHCEIA